MRGNTRQGPPDPWDIFDMLGDERIQKMLIDAHEGKPLEMYLDPRLERWTMTRKQYYTRLNLLTTNGLVRKVRWGSDKKGYVSTTFGKLMVAQLQLTRRALEFWTEINMLDDLEQLGIPPEKKREISRKLLGNGLDNLLLQLGVEPEGTTKQ